MLEYFKTLLDAKNYYYAKSQGLSPDWFNETVEKYFVSLLELFHRETNVDNPRETFVKIAATAITDDIVRASFLLFIDQILKVNPIGDFVTTTDLYKNQYLSRLLSSDLLKVTKLLGKGDYASAVATLQELTANTAQMFGDCKEADARHYWHQIASDPLTPGLSTGFKTIDEATCGLHGGEFIALMSGPGEGKSTLMQNIGYNIFLNKKNIIYISIEMPLKKLYHRFLSMVTGIPSKVFKTNELTPEQQEIVRQTIKGLEVWPSYYRLVDAPIASAALIEAKIKEQSVKPDLVIVDYLAIVQASGGMKDRKQWESIGQTTVELRALARKYDVPLLTAVQVNRDATKIKDRDFYEQYDIAGSFPVIQHADIVISTRIPNKDVLLASPHCNMNAKFVKDRDGEQRAFIITADFSTFRMEEPLLGN